jgi:hypothetical protein
MAGTICSACAWANKSLVTRVLHPAGGFTGHSKSGRWGFIEGSCLGDLALKARPRLVCPTRVHEPPVSALVVVNPPKRLRFLWLAGIVCDPTSKGKGDCNK